MKLKSACAAVSQQHHFLPTLFTQSHTRQAIDDLLGGLDIGASTAPPPDLPVVLDDPAKGIKILGKVVRSEGGIGYHIAITNSTQSG